MKEIASYLIGKLADFLPGFIISRLFPPRKIVPQIELRLQGEKPITLANSSRLDFYLEIINQSNLELVLDRMLVDCWFGQPTLVGTMSRRHLIPARNTTKNIRYTHDLTSAQKNQIDIFSNDQSTSVPIQLHLTAYFESKSGLVEVNRTLERSKI
jgi:hypothetical protein